MLTDRHKTGLAETGEWGPHGLSDDWQGCSACTDIPKDHAAALMIRAYWRAVDVLEDRL